MKLQTVHFLIYCIFMSQNAANKSGQAQLSLIVTYLITYQIGYDQIKINHFVNQPPLQK